VALLLVAAVVAYDGVLKNTLLGPGVMGLCRALNVLLGMSTQPGAIWLFDLSQGHAWRFGTMVAAGIGLYIMGVTRFARHEAVGASTSYLASRTVGFNLGLLLVALASQSVGGLSSLMAEANDPYWLLMEVSPNAVAPGIRLVAGAVLWVSVVIATNVMAWRAAASGQPRAIQQAVKTCILALIALDAAVVAFVLGPTWAAVVLSLLVPTLFLGRWVYST
jgi:4-hydroxybenzoate polyprenyltransferase